MSAKIVLLAEKIVLSQIQGQQITVFFRYLHLIYFYRNTVWLEPVVYVLPNVEKNTIGSKRLLLPQTSMNSLKSM